MSDPTEKPEPAADPDRPTDAGALTAFRLGLGRLAISASVLMRPRISLGVRLAAFDAEGRVFLVRHSYLPGFYLPGGGVEPGESCREAILREAHEEGNLALAAPPALFHVYWNRALRGRDHVVLFVARNAEVAPEPAPRSLEVLDAGFHAPGGLPEDTTPATRARIAEVLEGRAPPDIW